MYIFFDSRSSPGAQNEYSRIGQDEGEPCPATSRTSAVRTRLIPDCRCRCLGRWLGSIHTIAPGLRVGDRDGVCTCSASGSEPPERTNGAPCEGDRDACQ